MKNSFCIKIFFFLIIPVSLFAQTRQDSLPPVLSLDQCIKYALQNQPALRQAGIDEAINERDIGINLAAWLPQVNSNNSATHYFKGSPTTAAGTTTTTGTSSDIHNVSILGVQASQVIYNNDVLLASRASKFSREYYRENTTASEIQVVSDVSKAFYDVLLSQRQLEIIRGDIIRLQRSLKDAYARYQAGVVDKTDYKQATIALNNSLASRKQTEEAIKSKSAYLRQQMGMPAERPLTLAYDSTRFEREAVIDTNQMLDYTNRIEYRLLETRRNLTSLNINYYKYGFLPSISANGAYNFGYFSNKLGDLYGNSYPSAYVGLTLAIPIFTGGKRLQNLAKARLQVERNDFDLLNSRNTINTQYVQAMANYKSNYNNWQLLKQNVELANDVYKVVSLQYREGIKTYLDLIISQSDLRTAQLNYFNALFQVLSSKIDLQKALGTLNPTTVR
jgi:outer membrane protein TolC